MKKLRVAVLISGRGSNMGALARAAIDPEYPVEIVTVISNRPNVEGLTLAREHGIDIRVVDHSTCDTREEHELALSQVLDEINVELICLAGYLRILTDTFINKWRGQIINIHPSLLPSFPGLDTHERALERGIRVHGCTVHFVNAELDGGPIIAQGVVPILPNDDAAALSARVLEMEHRIYPHALALIATRKVRWTGDHSVADMDVTVDDVVLIG